MAAAQLVADALRGSVRVDDPMFDQLYPDHVRRLSRVHWTPVAVALRAAALLAPEPGLRVLDVGAGAGKLCCVGALACGGAWHGVEVDPSLVAAATVLARRLELQHATKFAPGDLHELDWDRFDSLYFYNPFESVLFGAGPADRAGWTVFADRVARAEARLAALVAGTRVVTFHGFGGEMPASFALAFSETIGEGQLALWVKQATGRRARTHGCG
jgi:predicted RNA methylase